MEPEHVGSPSGSPWPPSGGRGSPMPILINDSSRYAAAAASRALSLAIRTEALADEIDALHRDVRASRDEPVRRAGFRCDAAIGWMRQAGTGLQRDCRPPG